MKNFKIFKQRKVSFQFEILTCVSKECFWENRKLDKCPFCAVRPESWTILKWTIWLKWTSVLFASLCCGSMCDANTGQVLKWTLLKCWNGQFCPLKWTILLKWTVLLKWTSVLLEMDNWDGQVSFEMDECPLPCKKDLLSTFWLETQCWSENVDFKTNCYAL